MLSYAAALLVLAPSQVPARPPLVETRMCEARLTPPGFPHAIVRIHVDAAHALVDRTLLYSTRDYKANWSVPGPTLDANSKLTHFNGLSFTLPHDVAYPIILSFAIDGREIARRRFARPTLNIVYSSEVQRPAWIGAGKPDRFQPGVDFELDPGALPLLGASSAELTGASASGERIGTLVLPLPDWTGLAEAARPAFSALEAQRMHRQCTKPLYIEVTGDDDHRRRRR